MPNAPASGERKLIDRFRAAFRGVRRGVGGERNFRVHLALAVAVVVAAALLQASRWEWTLLVVSIGGVLAAEMFNTALETTARAITDQHDEHIRDALDIASGAVLIAATSASVVGVLVLGHRLGAVLGWWAG